MSLKEYNRKRRPGETPEPVGERKVGSGELRFVIQLHEATKLHYDFRLEHDGAFQSWAIPKGPSLNPNDQRLAVHVEDHPMDYGDFEGVIPKGNYGAGTVMIWDRGTFIERSATGREDSEQNFAKGMAKGHITFLISGSKIGGEFALVRLDKDNTGKAWLLLKKRDEFATYKVDEPQEARSAATGRTMAEIAAEATGKGEVWLPGSGLVEDGVLKRGLANDPPLAKPKRMKKGLTAKPPSEEGASTSWDTAPTEALPRKLKPMLFTELAGECEGEGWLYEPRPGGVRALAEIEGGSVRLHSKQFLPFDQRYPEITRALQLPGRKLVVDGEIVTKGESPRSAYWIYDLLHLDGKSTRGLPLSERKRLLAALPFFGDVLRLVPDARDEPAPGTQARHSASIYKPGTSSFWVKPRDGAALDRPTLTNLGRVFWPKEGYTKGDVIEYYRAVAPFILPYLAGRPESMHRHPHGIDGESFFQKDVSGYLPPFVSTTRVESSERTIDYLICDNEATLLYMANLGCIELNPWLSRVPQLDRPTFVVVDLDPAEQSFAEVVKVAKVVQDVLQMIGVKGFLKTSGSSGLHIYLPVDGSVSYDEGRGLTEAICRIVEARLPNLTTMERAPARRGGRLYLDCLQNRRSQTLAAPYCVRPRPGATVSAPLHWSELTETLTPAAFTIKTMPGRLNALGDVWQGIDTQPVDVAAALSRLSSLKG